MNYLSLFYLGLFVLQGCHDTVRPTKSLRDASERAVRRFPEAFRLSTLPAAEETPARSLHLSDGLHQSIALECVQDLTIGAKQLDVDRHLPHRVC